MSGFARTLQKRVLKRFGFHRHHNYNPMIEDKTTGHIVDKDGKSYGKYYPVGKTKEA